MKIPRAAATVMPSRSSAKPKPYDQAYFDRWYRDQARRIRTPADLARKVACILSVADYLCGAPVRSVLDVGCGEGAWAPVLRRLRPRLRYVGVDASEYAVHRFGRTRNILQGEIGALDQLELEGPFDLVVCADTLQYVPTQALDRGLYQLRGLMGGVAFLEAFTTDDEMTGDLSDWHHRSRDWYRRRFARVGLVPVGLHCYVGHELEDRLTALERLD